MLRFSPPAVSVVDPEKLFDPERTRVPVPFLVKEVGLVPLILPPTIRAPVEETLIVYAFVARVTDPVPRFRSLAPL